jgi:hypothetical protein
MGLKDLFMPNLVKLQKNKDIGGLLRTLNYRKKPILRGHAASILGKLGNVRAVGPLIKLLEDEDSYVISKAIEALAELRDARAVGPLLKFFGRGSTEAILVRRAFEKIGPVSFDPIIKIITDPESESQTVGWALKGLYHTGQFPDWGNVLPRFLSDPNTKRIASEIAFMLRFADEANPLRVKVVFPFMDKNRDASNNGWVKFTSNGYKILFDYSVPSNDPVNIMNTLEEEGLVRLFINNYRLLPGSPGPPSFSHQVLSCLFLNLPLQEIFCPKCRKRYATYRIEEQEKLYKGYKAWDDIVTIICCPFGHLLLRKIENRHHAWSVPQ